MTSPAEITVATIVRELEASYPPRTIRTHPTMIHGTTIGTCTDAIFHPLIITHDKGNSINISMNHKTLEPYLDCILKKYMSMKYVVGLTVPGDVKRWFETNGQFVNRHLTCDQFQTNKERYMAMFKFVLDLHDVEYKGIEPVSFEIMVNRPRV